MVTPGQTRLIVSNVKRVFRDRDIDRLSNPAYRFIIGHMGHIAHFSLYGYRASYQDLRLFARTLRTSEYRDDAEYNARWADECDRRVREEPRSAGSYVGVGETIRQILAVVAEWEPTIIAEFSDRERTEELETARALAAKHGYVLTTERD